MRSIREAPPAAEAIVARLSMPPEAEVQKTTAIADCDFQRLVQRAEQGELTEPEFQQLMDDRERAVRKRKYAVKAGRYAEAASASSREQTTTRVILVPYALSGVRAKPGRKKGGKASAKQAQKQGKEMTTKVHELATQLLASAVSPREISGIICRRVGRSRPTVLKHLRDHPSGHWEQEKVK